MFLTKKQVAERLHVEYNHVVYLIQKGYLPVHRTAAPRKVWVKEADLVAFIASRPDFAQRIAA